jgi:hypothetical protein
MDSLRNLSHKRLAVPASLSETLEAVAIVIDVDIGLKLVVAEFGWRLKVVK